MSTDTNSNVMEFRLGQKLAHTGIHKLHMYRYFVCKLLFLCMIDKRIRDKAVKALHRYVQKKQEWSELDMDKVWKAMFYCK